MNSVLLIGNECFTTSVMTQVRGLCALTSTAVKDVSGAIALMHEVVPDVVIVQASQLIEDSVLKTFSQEQHSIYFVVLDILDSVSQSHLQKTLQETQPSSNPLQIAAKLADSLSEAYVEKKVVALEAGADAYIWILPVPEAPQAQSAAASETVLLSGALVSEALVSTVKATDPKVFSAASHIAFRTSQQRLIQAYVQIGLNRAQRYRDLSRINDWLSAVALVDALTQLSNRRSFDLELPRQIKVARAKGTPLSLMVVDIDFFKAVNDRYGHLVGDEVLKVLAKRLLSNMRFYDTPFRYGGEEFVVTLSNTDLAEGIIIAQRLRHAIDQEPFDIDPSVSHTAQLPLTISIGLTELKESDDPQGRSFLHRADQYLLEAKASGRNQVISDRNNQTK